MRKLIIKTEQYLLLVSEEIPNENDWCINPKGQLEMFGYDYRAVFSKQEMLSCKSIIAHLPLNGAEELEGVALLPKLENEGEKFVDECIEELFFEARPLYRELFRKGFNKAKQTYKYTEQDLIKAVDMCIELMNNKGSEFRTHKQTILQSLELPKYPIAFDIKLERCRCKYGSVRFNNHPCKDECQLKDGLDFETTINLQGKEELVGTYIFQ